MSKRGNINGYATAEIIDVFSLFPSRSGLKEKRARDPDTCLNFRQYAVNDILAVRKAAWSSSDGARILNSTPSPAWSCRLRRTAWNSSIYAQKTFLHAVILYLSVRTAGLSITSMVAIVRAVS